MYNIDIMINLKHIQFEYMNELTFYRSYHRNSTNWIIHAITIPMEWSSTLLVLCCIGQQWNVAVVTSLYFLLTNSRIALAASAAQLVLCYVADRLYRRIGFKYAILAAISAHVTSWAAQVLVGHGIYEKNKPAMTKKLTLNSIILSVILSWDYCTE